jgi:hypothetical protein
LNINLNLLWFKEDVTQLIYGGKRLKIIEACHGVNSQNLELVMIMVTHRTVVNGYKYLLVHSLNNLINFFKYGGVDCFNEESEDFS